MPELRMFALCEGMKWAHLPVEGGIYAQDPRLLSRFMHIFGERAAYEEQQRKRRDQQQAMRKHR